MSLATSTKTKRGWIVGRWNPSIEKCQYLTGRRWQEGIDNARVFIRKGNPTLNDISDFSVRGMPVFICKVFCKEEIRRYSGGYKVIKPTKLNYWQKLEGILSI